MSSRVEADNKKLQDQFQTILLDLLKLPENRECADCKAKGPRWASASLGIFVCIKCSGIHRSLGTHISFVRSVTLDKWTTEQVKNMQEVGNGRAAEIYEATLPEHFRRPSENDTYALEQFIRAKYDRKEYMIRDTKPKASAKKTTTAKKSSPATTTKSESAKKLPDASPIIDLLGDPTPPVNQQSTSQSNPSSSAIFEAFQGASPSPVNNNTAFEGFQGFQSANSSFSGFSGQAAPTNQFNAQFNNQTIQPNVVQSSSALSPEMAFFGGDASSQQTQQPKSKESILELFAAQPNASSQNTNAVNANASKPLNNPAQPKSGANYNVVLPGLGMPATQPYHPPQQGGYQQGGFQQGGFQQGGFQQGGFQQGGFQQGGFQQGGFQQGGFQQGGYGGIQGQGFQQGGYGYGSQRPVSGPNSVNTNGYVNANYQASQQTAGFKYM